MNQPANLEASFSTLALSIGSSAMMALGLAPNPQSSKQEIDLNMAKFNIDLLLLLQEKTKNNLSEDEEGLIVNIIGDLQMRYVEASKN